ncbi:MAG: CBS domain-containing protein [Promethearchaeota archaeon]|jgi:predicted transcriptional regulator
MQMQKFPPLSEIKPLRKNLNISQKDLADEMKLTQSTISRIESGTVDPPYSKVKNIFEYLEGERIARKKSKKQAKDIMTRKIISIKPTSSIRDAVELMNEHGYSQLPLLEKNDNFGSITSKKIQKIITDNPKMLGVEVSLIKELPFPEVDENWNVKDISDLLVKYSAVLVKGETHNIVGIITDADFLKLTNNL